MKALLVYNIYYVYMFIYVVPHFLLCTNKNYFSFSNNNVRVERRGMRFQFGSNL